MRKQADSVGIPQGREDVNDNAVAHATAAGESFNATVFSGERRNKAGYLPPASVACMQI